MSSVAAPLAVTRVQRFEAYDPERGDGFSPVLPSQPQFTTPTSAIHGLALLTTVPSSGAHRAVLARLLEMPYTEFDNAVLQLVHAVVTHRCARTEDCVLGLRRLLCRLASQSLHLAVKLLWTIEALAPNADKTRSALEGLREVVEAAAVNGSEAAQAAILAASPTLRAVVAGAHLASAAAASAAGSGAAGGAAAAGLDGGSGDSFGGSSAGGASSFAGGGGDNAGAVEEMLVQLKMGRASLLHEQRLFFAQLVGISDFLRQIPDRSNRLPQLRMQLSQLGSTQRRVFMPFGGSGERPRWIVRILPNEAVVFSSRERAPYLLVVETVTAPPVAAILGGSAAASPPAAAAALALAASRATCADPDVREAEALHLIGASSSGFHTYPKAHDPTFGEPSPAQRAADAQRQAAAAGASSAASGATAGGAGAGGGAGSGSAATKLVQLASPDPFRESMAAKRERVRATSPFSHLPGWRVENIIVKAGDDLTQEQLALEVTLMLHNIWQAANVPVYVLPYRALSCVYDGGVMECVDDANSIDSLKKAAGVQTLHQFFLKHYGEGTAAHALAQRNFIESMAGYSVVCFLMQVRDRHNANLMLTRAGHLVHIDFGFMFGKAPGGIQFESAPFKLSQELLDTMGGANSEGFKYFKLLVHLALSAVRENGEQLLQLVDVMARRSGMKCFGEGTDASAKLVLDDLKQRLALGLTSEVDVARFIKQLVDDSCDNWRTKKYDQFQRFQNGYV